MNTKKSLRIIESLGTVGMVGIILLILAFGLKFQEGHFNIPLLVLAVFLSTCYLIRNFIISTFLRKVSYPGIMYAVLDKLFDTSKFGIELSDELLNEVYHPHYTTEAFLSDNKLLSHIGRNKLRFPWAIISFLASAALFIFISSRTSFLKEPFLNLVLLSLVVGNLLLFFSERKKLNDPTPLLRFEDKGLFNREQFIAWKDIVDWKFESGSKYSSPRIMVSYQDEQGQLCETSIVPDEVNADRIEILMLLSFFKTTMARER
jgi:hypothetical protein